MQNRLSERIEQKRRRLAQSSVRNSQGWSLVATLCMMVVITIFVGAMWSALLPAYAHLINLRYKDAARAVNEAAIDSTLAGMNNGIIGQPVVTGATTSLASTINQGAASYNTSTTITDLGSAPPVNCVFYSAARPATSMFYVLANTTTKATLSRTLSVLLEPNPGVPATSPFSNGPAYGVTTVNQVGLACVNGYNLPVGWTSPYQFADTTVVKGITWQIGNGQMDRSQVIAGSQFEFWHPGDSPPALPPVTSALTYEPFTQIMGNVYSNYADQNGANGNGYWSRNQLSDVTGAPNVPGGSAFGAPATANANVFGASNGTTLNGQGVPSGYQSGSSNSSVPIPPYSAPPPGNGSGSTTNPAWGYNAVAGSNGGNLPAVGTTDGGASYLNHPNTGGYITSPGAGVAGALDTWNFPAPPVQQAPGAPIGSPAPATGGLGVPNKTGTYFSSSPANIVINGGTLVISNTATTVPASISVPTGQTLTIPPGNYNIASLQVVNNGKIVVDPAVQGQTQLFVTPAGVGQGTAGAIYVDNTSSINTLNTGGSPQVNGGSGFTQTGTQHYGNALPANQPAVNTASPITESAGSCLNLVINTNAACNMLFAGNTRALVNAPNSNVNVGYQPNPSNNNNYTPNSHTDPGTNMTNDANFYGAIIAQNASIVSSYSAGAGAYLHYDVKLKQIDSMPGNPVTFGKPLSWYDPWQFANGGGPAPGAATWHASSWQEQLGAW